MLFGWVRLKRFDCFNILIVDFRLSIHLTNVSSMKTVKASNEKEKKGENTNRNDSPCELCLLVLDDRSPDAHARMVIFRLSKRCVGVEFAL